MFYQDETLKALLAHSNALVTLLQQEYGDVTYLTEPLEIIIEEEDDEEKEKNNQRKDVFYGGSRKGDSWLLQQ